MPKVLCTRLTWKGIRQVAFFFFFLSPKGELVILQLRQGRTLVLAIGPPRAGLGILTEVGVRCVKEVVVLSFLFFCELIAR